MSEASVAVEAETPQWMFLVRRFQELAAQRWRARVTWRTDDGGSIEMVGDATRREAKNCVWLDTGRSLVGIPHEKLVTVEPAPAGVARPSYE